MARTVYTLEVTILDGVMTNEFVRQNPVVSRTIEIRGDQTLNQLHRSIFGAFDRWDDCHLSEFHFGSKPRDRHAERYVLPFIYDDPEEYDEPPAAGSVTQTRLGGLELEVGSLFWYWYDFGDNWYHEIRVLAVGDADPKAEYPRVTARVGASPPQYPEYEDEWEEEGPTPRDWVGELLQHGAAELGVESGVIPIGDGALVPWIRRRVSADTAAFAADLVARRTYQVTTLRAIPEGNGELTTYLVPGEYLAPWLNGILQDDEGTVVSVEAV